jgi:hypothetical protein
MIRGSVTRRMEKILRFNVRLFLIFSNINLPLPLRIGSILIEGSSIPSQP